MQINWGHWGNKFGLSKSELLDPQLNVLVGARILEHCVRVSGSWWKGVALYHSPHDFDNASMSRRFGSLIGVC